MNNDIQRNGNDFDVVASVDEGQEARKRMLERQESMARRQEAQAEYGPTFLGFTPQKLLRLREEMGEWAFYEFLAKAKGRQQYTGFSGVVMEVKKEYKAWLQAGGRYENSKEHVCRMD